MAPRPAVPAALVIALAILLPACAGTGPAKGGTGAAAPAAPAAAADPAAPPGPAAGKPADAPSPPPSPPSPPPPKEEPPFAAPSSLPAGDRWYAAVRPAEGGKAVVTAERHRRRLVDGVLREEVTWGGSFSEVAGARHGTAQVFALFLDGGGLAVSLLDADGKPAGERRLEVAAPFRPGTTWTVEGPGGLVAGRIEAVEEIDTPAGKVRAMRVLHAGGGGSGAAMTTWYDGTLRPVRSEVRRGGPKGMLVEARAALASESPSPEESRAALEWAEKNLGK